MVLLAQCALGAQPAASSNGNSFKALSADDEEDDEDGSLNVTEIDDDGNDDLDEQEDDDLPGGVLPVPDNSSGSGVSFEWTDDGTPNGSKGGQGNGNKQLGKPAEKMSVRIANIAGRALQFALRMEERITNSKVLDDDEKAMLQASIDAHVSYFEDVQSNTSNASSLSELKGVIKEMRSEWKDLLSGVKASIGLVWTARVDNAIEKSKNATAKVEAKIAGLKANGTDTSSAEQMLSRYNAKISAAQANNEAAKAKFGAITGADDIKQLFSDGKALVHDAITELKDAIQAMKNLIQELKSIGGIAAAP